MPGHPQKKKVSGVGMGGDPRAGPQQPTDPPQGAGLGMPGLSGAGPRCCGSLRSREWGAQGGRAREAGFIGVVLPEPWGFTGLLPKR